MTAAGKESRSSSILKLRPGTITSLETRGEWSLETRAQWFSRRVLRRKIIVLNQKQIDEYVAGQVALNQQSLTKLEYFNIFRTYRLAEYDLLNHRLTWNLAIQGFLFATYGLCIQKLAEAANPNDSHVDGMIREHAIGQIQFLMFIIPLVGCLLSICVFNAVRAAQIALKKLRNDWREQVESRYPPGPYIPDPAGVGVQKVINRGFWPPLAISLILALAWLAILISVWHWPISMASDLINMVVRMVVQARRQ